jgi:thioredoxin reductase (NADPH)
MYDLIIIGAGPSGLTASIYASCFHLNHLVISTTIGGQLLLAPDILNYPGFESISGKELTEKMLSQMKKRGGELITQSVTRISNFQYPISNGKETSGFEVETKEGNKYQSRAIILATGTERRKLGVSGEVEYTARGVHYCATCEKFDYKDKVCGVVGGGNSAVQAAVELAQAAKKVYIIYRGSELRGEAVWLEQVKSNKIIEVIYNTVVTEIVGDKEKMTGVRIRQLSNNPINTNKPMEKLDLDKIFIEIGGVPGSALIIPLGVNIDKVGRIAVDERLATNIPGVFACGDLVSSGLSIEQIASSVGLGARAAFSAFTFIKSDKAPTVWGKSQIKR